MSQKQETASQPKLEMTTEKLEQIDSKLKGFSFLNKFQSLTKCRKCVRIVKDCLKTLLL